MSQQGVDLRKKISKMKMDRQKLGTILENKVVQKLKLSKIGNNKKPSSKLIFFNEKEITKIQMIFGIEN